MRAVFRASAVVAAAALPGLLLAEEGAEAAGGHGEASGAVIPPTAWGILVFLTVLVILWRKAFPPIIAALEKRAQLIKDSIEAAEKARAEAEAMMKQHEASLEKSRAEARAIIEQGKADAVRVKDSIVQSAKRDTEELTARARREIELAKRTAVHELHRQAARLSIEIAQKVIKKSLKAEDHEALIKESIQKYEEAKKAS